MTVAAVAFYNTALMVVMGHFLLGYGLQGGSWGQMFGYLDRTGGYVEEGLPPYEPWAAPLLDSLGSPAVLGVMTLMLGWPALLGLYWAIRPGGRQYR